MASEVIYVTIDAPTIQSIPTTIAGSPTNVVDVDVIGDYNAIIAMVNNAVPSGTIIQGGWTTEPPNYKFLNGQTLTGGVALYPTLANYYPSWVSGPDIVLPNMSGLVMLGTTGTAGTRPITSNAKTVLIGVNNLPAHSHTMSFWSGVESQGHVHYLASPGTNGSGGQAYGGWAPTWDMWAESAQHYHPVNAGSEYLYRDTGYNTGWTGAWMQPGGSVAITWNATTNWDTGDHDHTFSAGSHVSGAHQQHQHLVSGSTADNTTTGTALPYDTTPAHMLVKFAVKL
jgi:hypothetical protein